MACNTEPDSRYVIAIGAAALDEYYTADTWPSEGGKAMVDYKEDMIGGMIPNAACVFAGYGVHTYLVDTLKNNSKKTDMIVSDLKAHGVKTGLLRYQDDIPDARTIIIRTHRERTILVVEPHKPLLDIKACELDIFRKASYIYTTPVELKNIRNYMEFVDDMKNHHVKLAFDIEASTVDACDKELIYKGDVLFFNEFGFEKIKGNRGEEEAFSEMFENGVEIATITLGEKGSFTATKNETFRTPAVKQQVVDTTGAGDTFNSSFITYLLMGKSIREAALFANAAGGYSVTQYGPKGGVNDLSFIEELVTRYYQDNGRKMLWDRKS